MRHSCRYGTVGTYVEAAAVRASWFLLSICEYSVDHKFVFGVTLLAPYAAWIRFPTFPAILVPVDVFSVSAPVTPGHASP